MADSIESGADYIDVRDVIARVEELRAERDGWVLGAPDGSETPNPEGWAEDNPDEAEELDLLESFLADLRGNGGDEQWEGAWYPVTLIRESEFVNYCQESLEDWGVISKELPSFVAIDWERTADNMRVDYSTVDFEGTEYLYR